MSEQINLNRKGMIDMVKIILKQHPSNEALTNVFVFEGLRMVDRYFTRNPFKLVNELIEHYASIGQEVEVRDVR